MCFLMGKRLTLRPVTDSPTDTATVVYWRNSNEARNAFWSKDVVTPDTHAAFCANRPPHDFTWLALDKTTGEPVGMGGLTVDTVYHRAEWGRIFVDPAYRQGGYGREMVSMVFDWAFEALNLEHVWIEAYADNEGILNMYHKMGLVECVGTGPQRDRPTTFRRMLGETWRARG